MAKETKSNPKLEFTLGANDNGSEVKDVKNKSAVNEGSVGDEQRGGAAISLKLVSSGGNSNIYVQEEVNRTMNFAPV